MVPDPRARVRRTLTELLAISYASLAIAATGIWSLPGDVAPSSRHVASIGGIQNFASNIAGIISPFVFGRTPATR